MDLKDFKLPLLSQLSGIASVISPLPEEAKIITMDDASKEIEDMISERLAQTVSVVDEIIQLRVTKDDKLFVVLTEKDIVTYDTVTNERNSRKPVFAPRYLELFNDDKYAILGRNGETKMLVYELSTLTQVQVLDTHKSKIIKMYMVPDRKSVITLMEDEVLRWNLDDLKKVKLKLIASEKFERAFLSPDSKMVAFTQGNTLSVYSIEEKRKGQICSKEMGGKIGCVEFAPSGEFIAVSTLKTIKFRNLSNLNEISDKELVLDEVVTSLKIAKTDDIIIVGTHRGNIILNDLKNHRDPIVLNIHKTAVNNIILNDNETRFYSTETDQKRKISSTQFPRFPLMRKIPSSMIISFSPDNKLFLKARDGLKLLDVKKNEQSHISSAEGINTVICVGLEKIIISQLSQIVVINCTTQESFSMDDPDFDIPMTLISNNDGTLLFTGSKQKIKIWDLQTCTLTANWKGHDDDVACLLLVKQETRLISGSFDNLIKIWDATTHTLLSTLKGHQGDISKFQITKDEKLLFSSSSDKTFRIWNWELEVLVCTITATAAITGLYLSDDENFIITSSVDGRITYWSMKSYTRIFYNQTRDKIRQMIVSPNGRYMAYVLGENDCYVVANPLAAKGMTVSGPSEGYYQYLLYLKSIMVKTDIPEPKAEMDDWIILPYCLTVQHYYASSNLFAHLKKSLSEEFRAVESTFGETILSITMEKEFRDCRNLIIKSMIKNYVDNPFSLSCLTKEALISLNTEGFRDLIKLYELIFRRCMGYNLPSTCSANIELPIFYHSSEIVPLKEHFITERIPQPTSNELPALPNSADVENPINAQDAANYNPEATTNAIVTPDAAPDAAPGAPDSVPAAEEEQQAMYFMHCLIPLNITPGTQESLDFIRSLLNSPIPDIFRTQLVQAILQEKWNHVRWYMYPQGAVYFLYLLSFNLYVFFYQDNMAILAIPFVLSLMLSSYEAYQAFSAPLSYLEDFWNYLDMTRGTFMVVYTVVAWSGATPEEYSLIIMAAMLLTWVRGITYFRLYPPTRYIISLITEVLRDMLSFLFLLFYSTLAFSFVILIVATEETKETLPVYIANSYLINIGEYNTDGLSLMQSLVFFLVTMINFVVMMNLLISIIGDTFDRVQESLEIADFSSLAEMILEVEILLFWRRGLKETTYLQLCLDETIKGEADWTGKVRELKLLIKIVQDGQTKAAQMAIEDHKSLKQQVERTQRAVTERNSALKLSLELMKKEQLDYLHNKK